MQVYELVRRSVLVEGKSLREASREFGVCWRTLKNMVQEPYPQGYRGKRARSRPRLGPFEASIAKMLQQDATALRSWQDEIAAMWRFTQNNGITEGFHN